MRLLWLMASSCSVLSSERYNRTVRHEWLDIHAFESIEQAQLLAIFYEKPDNAIGVVSPR
jgi:putative transposase